ncbi:hypothetical protein P5673_015611 [Acropora cervicornis]|uniref:Kinesin-like protein KIF26A/B helical domain-containing protein n=1 Tax=Acropora cervicornis TaxID=6130 RepID=A0AAD9QHZ3_ACRCE|nr:hypothetical protein P5673_015611 [Acropora cervicornis]
MAEKPASSFNRLWTLGRANSKSYSSIKNASIMNDLRASGGTRNLRTSTKSNEMPRELGICCEKCNNRLVELKRQVMRLILPEIQGVIQSQKKTKNVSKEDEEKVFCFDSRPRALSV